MPFVKSVSVLLLVAGAGYVLYTQAVPLLAPCKEALTYEVSVFDERFGIARVELEDALADAAALLNDAAGTTVVEAGTDAKVQVVLSYGNEQAAAELGENIDAEQSAYDAKRTQVEGLRTRFLRAKRAYEANLAAFERRADAYEKEVEYWNGQGGAPPAEYAKLQQEGNYLQAEQEKLEEDAREVNLLAEGINKAVEDLNALAGNLNAKVDVYNQEAGEDFDQGRYVEENGSRTIYLYEFTDGIELRRVLAHELGHALGMEHVENPESVLYSYNLGEEFVFTAEDVAELKRACRLE